METFIDNIPPNIMVTGLEVLIGSDWDGNPTPLRLRDGAVSVGGIDRIRLGWKIFTCGPPTKFHNCSLEVLIGSD